MVGGPIAVAASDVPFRIGSFIRVADNTETQVILFNSQSGGVGSPRWTGERIKLGVLTPLNALEVIEIPAPPGTWIFGADVSVDLLRCWLQVSLSCCETPSGSAR